jgi:D-serine deaminase-like pyridoxal phosphate-dependent protein
MASLPTPRVVIDETIVRANIDRMASFARASGIALRPHVKTHKSVALARLQLEAGAVGITVATIGEAEVFAEAGFDDIFIAYPLWADESNERRLRALAERIRLRVGVASGAGARRLAERAPGLEVAVEVDSGHHRTGAAPHAAGDIAGTAADAGLRVAGVFTFPGHGYRPGGIGDAVRQESAALAEARSSAEARGIEVRLLSGGSTPTAVHADATVLTEVRPGIYLFNDAQQVLLDACRADDVALTVEATIVFSSATHAVANAGSKMLGADRQDWTDGYGRIDGRPDARITALSEHHATIVGTDLREGDRIRILPNHVCTVVNLADELWVEHGSVERIAVDARGRNA